MNATNKMIEVFVRSPNGNSLGDGEFTLVDAGLELLTQKKIIFKFENFSFGLVRLISLDVDETEKYRSSTWNFRLKYDDQYTIFKYDRFVIDGYQFIDADKDIWHCVEASILYGSSEMKKWRTYSSSLLKFTNDNISEIFRISDKTVDLPLINGALVIEVNLKLLRDSSTVMKKLDVSQSQDYLTVRDKRVTNFRAFLMSKTFSDVKIISSCGKEFPAHKIILSGECEVFNAMFQSEMTESSTGVVKLEDMSAAAASFLLHFLYCRVILPLSINGKKVEIETEDASRSSEEEEEVIAVEEALYVASKYRLEPVLNYIDGVFRRMSNEENAVCLFELSKMHSLKCKDFLKEFIMCQPRIISKILEP